MRSATKCFRWMGCSVSKFSMFRKYLSNHGRGCVNEGNVWEIATEIVNYIPLPYGITSQPCKKSQILMVSIVGLNGSA